MATAEELLAAAHEHAVTDTDTHFIIDPVSRKIESPIREPLTIMQYDHNSSRYTFRLPRYIDGHDMSLCTSVVVNFDNIEDAESGATNSSFSDINDLRVNPDNPDEVICSWLISRAATQLVGTLSFSIEYKCTNDAGEVVYELGTDTFVDIIVKKRSKNSNDVVVDHVDVLEQWRTRIFGAGDSVLANITAEGEAQVAAVKMESETQQEAVELKGAETLESIPEDYTDTNNMADEAVRSKSDAIVCEAEGGTILLTDSSDDHIQGLKILGKSSQFTTTGRNLLDVEENIEFTYILDKSVTIPAGTYKLTYDSRTYDGAYPPYVCFYDNKVGALLQAATGEYSVTLATDETRLCIYANNYDAAGSTGVTASIHKLMLSVDGGTYEPYTGGVASPNPEYPQEIASIENPTINICSKNLVRTNNNKDVTYEGLHFLITKGLSEVVLNGTTTKSYGYAISEGTYLSPGRYTMSIHGLNNVSTKYDQAYLMNTNTRMSVCTEVKTGSPVTFDVLEGGVHCIDFLFAEGTTYNNATIRFQIEAGSEATDYEPCLPVQSLSITQSLHGIPVTSGGNHIDPDGQQWICDEVDLERGVYVQRVGEWIFNGTETWNVGGSVVNGLHRFFTWRTDIKIGVSGPGLCTHYTRTAAGGLSGITSECVRFGEYNSAVFFFSFDITDTDGWKKYLSEQYSAGTPVTIRYILATPIETPLTAEEITAFKALRTNYPNTTILNDAGAWMSVKYNADTKTYVENPKTLKLVDSSTGVVYELKIIDGNLTVVPI